MTNTDRAWVAFGDEQPYFGVLSKDQFTNERLDADARASFFASGEEFVDSALAVVRSRINPNFTPSRALDFGCGVGRLSIPLARRCREVVGVDVSPGMLAEAARAASAAEVSNVEFVVADDSLSRVSGRFDLAVSFIVFQHIVPSRGENILRQLLDRLDEDGVGILQFTYANGSATPLRRRLMTWGYERVPGLYGVRNLVKGTPFGKPQMHMNRYRLSRIFGILQEADCHDVHVRFTEASHYGYPLYGAILCFSKTRMATTAHS